MALTWNDVSLQYRQHYESDPDQRCSVDIDQSLHNSLIHILSTDVTGNYTPDLLNLIFGRIQEYSSQELYGFVEIDYEQVSKCIWSVLTDPEKSMFIHRDRIIQ
jgi:hypothetical protein